MTLLTYQDILLQAQKRLTDSSTPHLDAEVLLTEALDITRAHLLAHLDAVLQPEQLATFERLLTRREQGEPIAYILGHREFWSLDLWVNKDVLIPRPETELLVELALEKIPSDASYSIIDLGTGSGALALAIASERPQCKLLATERSESALTVAKQNAERCDCQNVTFYLGDWFEAVPKGTYDIIVGNPPYIREADEHLQQGDVRFEPKDALASGADGLDAIRTIITQAQTYLVEGGWLMLEHGYDQGKSVQTLMKESGFQNITDHQDLSGNDRVAVAQATSLI